MAGFGSGDKFEVNPSIRNEDVYYLDCRFCLSPVCERSMKSFLVADETTELYSTDQIESSSVGLTEERYHTGKCKCVIQNMACMKCGNILGYHVTMPCQPCLQSENNGHYWMFMRDSILSYPRLNLHGTDTMIWGDLADCDNSRVGDALWEECER